MKKKDNKITELKVFTIFYCKGLKYMFPYLKIMRLDHMIKQLFIIPGFILAFVLNNLTFNMNSIMIIGFAFIGTSLIASANYVINEWLDRDFDKFHPIKKKRPAVNTKLKSQIIWTIYVLLSVSGLSLSFILLPYTCFIAISSLWVMGIVYNVKPLRTKDIPYLDVITESVNNAIRLLIGYFAISSHTLPPSSIIIGYWAAGAYLMAIKRYSEYKQIANPTDAGMYRKSFKYYTESRLFNFSLFLCLFSVCLIVVFLTKYHIEYILAMPFICLLYVVYFNLSFQENSTATRPEKLFAEKGLMVVVLLLIIVLTILSFIHIPALTMFYEPHILEIDL